MNFAMLPPVSWFSLVILVFSAALATPSRMRAVGLLTGSIFALLPLMGEAVAQIVAPMQSGYGTSAPEGAVLSYTPLAGFWIAVGGIVLIAAAGMMRRVVRDESGDRAGQGSSEAISEGS